MQSYEAGSTAYSGKFPKEEAENFLNLYDKVLNQNFKSTVVGLIYSDRPSEVKALSTHMTWYSRLMVETDGTYKDEIMSGVAMEFRIEHIEQINKSQKK